MLTLVSIYCVLILIVNLSLWLFPVCFLANSQAYFHSFDPFHLVAVCWVVPKVYGVTVGEGNLGSRVSGESSRMGQLILSMLRMYVCNKNYVDFSIHLLLWLYYMQLLVIVCLLPSETLHTYLNLFCFCLFFSWRAPGIHFGDAG